MQNMEVVNIEPSSDELEVSLSDWVGRDPKDEDLRTCFLNLDATMKYVHSRGYCVRNFDPKSNIVLVNGESNKVKFNTLYNMGYNTMDQKELIKEDIYNSAYLQIGLYTKCLSYMNPKVLSEQYDEFATFLPEGDVPYYRGIVQRGASVYFNDYNQEKQKRDMTALGGAVNEANGGNGKSVQKRLSNGHSLIADNNNIYNQLNNNSEAAFARIAVVLSVVSVIAVVLLIMLYMFNIL